ncbi:DUF3846 domain-containing protein [Chroococcidiopsis sp.]|uniref:DUF3846 domain-containing protein n=1 Tax=Chroococcidiopsis sp. TaxID=3088168 RepID=UPI003F2BF9A2
MGYLITVTEANGISRVPFPEELSDLDSLKYFQGIVGGLVERVSRRFPDRSIIILCHEEGKILRLPEFSAVHGELFAGQLVILGERVDNGGELQFCGLTESQCLGVEEYVKLIVTVDLPFPLQNEHRFQINLDPQSINALLLNPRTFYAGIGLIEYLSSLNLRCTWAGDQAFMHEANINGATLSLPGYGLIGIAVPSSGMSQIGFLGSLKDRPERIGYFTVEIREQQKHIEGIIQGFLPAIEGAVFVAPEKILDYLVPQNYGAGSMEG